MITDITSEEHSTALYLPQSANGVNELTGLSFDEYRAHPGIAQSDLKSAWQDPQLYHQRLIGEIKKNPPTDSMKFGIEMERFLRNGHGAFKIIPSDVLSDSGRRQGSKWKEFKAANEGVLLLKEDEFEEKMRPFVAAHANTTHSESANWLLHTPMSRMWSTAYEWEHESGLHMKGELDLILPDHNIVVDIKTTRNERAESFAKSIVDFRYDVQAVQYLDAIERLTGEDWQYYWLCIRNSEPYSITVIECDSEWIELGQSYREVFIDNYLRRRRESDWYADDTPPCYIPAWERGPNGDNRY